MAVVNVTQVDRLLLPDTASVPRRSVGRVDVVLFSELVSIQAVAPFTVYELHPQAKAKDVMFVDVTIRGNKPGGGGG